jgi:hypothetical protein
MQDLAPVTPREDDNPTLSAYHPVRTPDEGIRPERSSSRSDSDDAMHSH